MNIFNQAWIFFQKQILGMMWLNDIVIMFLEKIGVDTSSKLGASIVFFIYDTAKIFILLSVLIFVISYIQSYFPPERTKKILSNFKGVKANIASALLGTVTPFCSCSSIPLFIGFTSAGIPIGTTFSFLISSPLVDLASFILLMSIFGFNVAFLYVLVGLVLAVVGGLIIEKLHMEKYVEDYIKNIKPMNIERYESLPSKKERLLYAKEQVLQVIKKVYPYVLIGVVIGAAIHNYIPKEYIEKVLGMNNPFSVIIATIVGVPIYADIFGTIPIAESLHAKGVGIGTILSFMMAVTTLSIPSLIMLREAVKTKLIIVFVSIVSVAIVIIGYMFNILEKIF